MPCPAGKANNRPGLNMGDAVIAIATSTYQYTFEGKHTIPYIAAISTLSLHLSPSFVFQIATSGAKGV